MKLRRKLVYTCVFSGYDNLRPPRTPSDDVHFVCITDDPGLKAPGWDVRVLDARREGLQDLDATRQSRYAKILPHRLFPDFDASLYVDANLELVGAVDPLLAHLEKHDIVFFRHPENRTDVYAEAEKCIALGKDDPARIKQQVDRYRATGFEGKSDPRFETIPAGMVILRNHQVDGVRETMEFWWSEYLKGSRRDQLSLAFVLNKSGQPHELLNGNSRQNECVEWRPHDSVQALRAARKAYAGADALILHAEGANLEPLKRAIEAGRMTARGLLARLSVSLGRLNKGRKIVFAPVPTNGKILTQNSAEWREALGVSGCPIAYIQTESATADGKAEESRLLEILSGHDAPTLVESLESLQAGQTDRFLDWCKRARLTIDACALQSGLAKREG